MKRSIFTIEELRERYMEHTGNALRGINPPMWNSSEERVQASKELYIRTQNALADVYADLISYRESDPRQDAVPDKEDVCKCGHGRDYHAILESGVCTDVSCECDEYQSTQPPQTAAVPARQPYWNCPNNPEHALESYPRLLSQNMRCKVCGIAPQFTVPARQDAVPDAIEGEVMPETPKSFEQPHKFEPKMWQGRKQLACEVCGYMEVAAIHVPARQDAVHAAKPEQFFPHPDAEMDIDAAAARQDAVPAFTQVVPCSDCGSSTTEHHPNCQMWARGTNLLTTQPPQAAVGENKTMNIYHMENKVIKELADEIISLGPAEFSELINTIVDANKNKETESLKRRLKNALHTNDKNSTSKARD